MLRVYTCITNEHDLRLVVLAGGICLLAALTSFAIFERARLAEHARLAWLALAGFVTGTGVWATHFVAMLGFRPDMPVGYDVALTLTSILVCVLISAAGWALSLRKDRLTQIAGSGLLGTAIAGMHYTGMSAVLLPGRLTHDSLFVAISVVISIAFAAAAVGEQKRRSRQLPWSAALIYTLGVCGLHFTGMAGASLIPDSRISIPASGIDAPVLAAGIAGTTLLILLIALILVVFDRKLARNALEEATRLRTFADAAVEGLVVVDGDRIVDANRSLLKIAGFEDIDAAPRRVEDLLEDISLSALRCGEDAPPKECRLLRADGSGRDVEILVRELDWHGKPLRVIAVRDTTERNEAARRIAHLAFHDSLTGLPNRVVLTEKLAEAATRSKETGSPAAVLCIDLDGFKAVNDLHGHPAGDALLIAAAQRLRSAARGDELVARLGGDEFAIVQYGEVQPDHAGRIADRILNAMGEPFAIGEDTVRISASIGIALFPADADDPEMLMRNADMALYRAKAEGRGTARFYEAAMDEALRDRRQLETDLRHAEERGELHVAYQPLADLDSGRIAGFEALLRWEHPRLGTISPGTFIPLAEETGTIVELGEWVLREACCEAARWSPSLKLSVNLSPAQFAQGDVAGLVEAILGETGLDPARLELEVTEGLLIKDADVALGILQRLKALGVRISMDDFGTGYSSLSYFRMFPFDKVKIDQSFIRDMIESPQARAIIRSVIGLSRGLGMPVVAEGVETAEQLEALRAEGCDQVQGYLISRPNPIGHFEGVVVDRRTVEEQRDAA
jgi:diguanylate cyclase (GGDEF)-like protein/PAS domain S-box-containing protein